MPSPFHLPLRQRGATLVVGLVLLLVLSILAVSTMSSATFGLTMVSNAQFGENAFQLAETGVDVAIKRGPFTTAPGGNPAIADTTLLDADGDVVGTYAASTEFQVTAPVTGFSTGSGTSTFLACHFQTQATGRSAKQAVSQNQQEFYVVCPGGP